MIYWLTAEDAPQLREFAQVRRLVVWPGAPKPEDPRKLTPVDDAMFTVLAAHDLEELYLQDCPGITGNGIGKLRVLRKLEIASGVELSSAAMREIATLANLETIQLPADLSKEHLEALAASTSLEPTAMHVAPQADSAPEPTDWLELFRSPVVEQLEVLVLAEGLCTDEIAQTLSRLPLQKLSVQVSNPDTERALAVFQSARPTCEIRRDGLR